MKQHDPQTVKIIYWNALHFARKSVAGAGARASQVSSGRCGLHLLHDRFRDSLPFAAPHLGVCHRRSFLGDSSASVIPATFYRTAPIVTPATLVLLAQLAAASAPSRPVLTFPEAGLDDTAAYVGYTTRFFRDVERNTLQIYLDRREGRVVQLFANGENESIGFSARTAEGQPADIRWDGEVAQVSRNGRQRRFSYVVTAATAELRLGRFVLGSMRVERDVQYFKEHRKPFTDAPYALPEFRALLATIERLPSGERRQALAELRAPTLEAAMARLRPTLARQVGVSAAPSAFPTALIQQLSIDGRDTMSVAFAALDGATVSDASARQVVLRARAGAPLRIRITISTTGRALAPLSREDIFTPEFLQWANDIARGNDSLRARWIERQITGVELLSSRDKLMAGLPTYATYFGRDMLMSALMMQPIWRAQMSEFVIAAALRKLAPNGEVSHEEALGGQAMREAASEFVALHARADSASSRARADRLRRQARMVLRNRRVTRENYHMVDDEYQLPILIARYLDDPRVTDAGKRAYLQGTEAGTSRLSLILAELNVVAKRTAPYADEPLARNLVAFAPRDATDDAFGGSPRWFAQSWRDSGAGYGNGKYAMDVNAIFVPQALAAMQRIIRALRALGFDEAMRQWIGPPRGPAAVLARYVDDSTALRAAQATWQRAAKHFIVRLSPEQIRTAVSTRLAAMPVAERQHWLGVPPTGEGLEMLALALDDAGQPIAVANSDPATRLFLDGLMGTASVTGESRDALRRDVSLFARAYPEGLLIPGIGSVVANDAYATAPIWKAFEDDPYHGPRVVWGREVNLFLLGIASHMPLLDDDPQMAALLRDAATKVRGAVDDSGFHSELWSYGFPGGHPVPQRYGSGADIQLWSTTDLAVQYVWSRLRP